MLWRLFGFGIFLGNMRNTLYQMLNSGKSLHRTVRKKFQLENFEICLLNKAGMLMLAKYSDMFRTSNLGMRLLAMCWSTFQSCILCSWFGQPRMIVRSDKTSRSTRWRIQKQSNIFQLCIEYKQLLALSFGMTRQHTRCRQMISRHLQTSQRNKINMLWLWWHFEMIQQGN